MTDDRKRKTGGEVERYTPEIVPDPDKPYIHFHYDPEGRWMLYRDHNRALAESRAEVERLRQSAVDKMRIGSEAMRERDHYKARAERLTAVLREIESKLVWSMDHAKTSLERKQAMHDAANLAALNLEPTP